ncbi:3-dehydrosphinganine reductase, partial [Nowakowskiella sp. JEL0078]
MNFTRLFEHWAELLVVIGAAGVLVPLAATIYILVAFFISSTFSSKKLEREVSGKTVLIAGGSKGFGKSLALDVARAGANIIIFARGNDIDISTGKSSLDKAVDDVQFEIQKRSSKSSTKQWVKGVKVDAMNYNDVLRAIRTEGKFLERLPEWIVCCVGGAKPGYSADRLSSEKGHTHAENQMSWNYYTSTHIVDAVLQVSKELAPSPSKIVGANEKDGIDTISGLTLEQGSKLPERFLFSGSGFSLVAFTGYGAYCASKFALRGYCDSLRQELLVFGVKVHLLCLGNVDTPGYIDECKDKPSLSAKLEGTVTLSSPDVVAKAIIASILSGRYIVSNDFLLELLRVTSNGIAPKPNPIVE